MEDNNGIDAILLKNARERSTCDVQIKFVADWTQLPSRNGFARTRVCRVVVNGQDIGEILRKTNLKNDKNVIYWCNRAGKGGKSYSNLERALMEFPAHPRRWWERMSGSSSLIDLDYSGGDASMCYDCGGTAGLITTCATKVESKLQSRGASGVGTKIVQELWSTDRESVSRAVCQKCAQFHYETRIAQLNRRLRFATHSAVLSVVFCIGCLVIVRTSFNDTTRVAAISCATLFAVILTIACVAFITSYYVKSRIKGDPRENERQLYENWLWRHRVDGDSLRLSFENVSLATSVTETTTKHMRI